RRGHGSAADHGLPDSPAGGAGVPGRSRSESGRVVRRTWIGEFPAAAPGLVLGSLAAGPREFLGQWGTGSRDPILDLALQVRDPTFSRPTLVRPETRTAFPALGKPLRGIATSEKARTAPGILCRRFPVLSRFPLPWVDWHWLCSGVTHV